MQHCIRIRRFKNFVQTFSKNFSFSRATDYIISAFQHVYNRGSWKRIVKVTESMSPYPDWFVARDCQPILDSAEDGLSVEVEFEENIGWCVF